MKNRMFLIVCSICFSQFFFGQTAFSAPASSVFHEHGGRIHRHVLPNGRIDHRHNGGAPGRSVNSTNWAPEIKSGIISSTVVYPHTNSRSPASIANKPYSQSEHQQVQPQPDKQKPSVIRSRPELAGSSSSRHVRNPGKIKQAVVESANQTLRYPLDLSKGDASCRRGEADCNVCAANIREQYRKAATGRISWRNKPWRFNWPQQYPPSGLRPLDIFDGDPVYALGIPDTHVQGFVRTNSDRFPYAGSHSHKRRGGIFVVRQERDGKKYLSSLHQTQGRHPSGVHALGKYLLYGDKNRLVFKDLYSPDQKSDIRLAIHNANFGGGLGAVRLSRNNYLLVTTGPGGQDAGARLNRFYHVRGVGGRPTSMTYITESRMTRALGWPRVYGFSENLSLMTECGTGDIYAIHTTGDEKGIKAINGNGYWRLSRLEKNHGALRFTPVNAFSTRQNMSSCNVRAAATVFVNARHQLEFYCHGYAKDPDGSTFNVLGSSSRNADKFYFRAGVLR